MKKLFITLTLIFTVLSTQAQEQFEGKWTSKNSTYTTTIIASEYGVLKVFNFSFKEDYFIEEEIISQNDYGFTTKLYNPRNGYEVLIKYYFLKDELYCDFFGDFTGQVKLIKI